MNAIIIYYSRKGHVSRIKNMLRKDFSIEEFELKLKKPYTGYFSTIRRVNKEKKNNIDVELNSVPINLDKYDIIFIGFPIWFNAPPTFFVNYLKSLNIKNKIVIPFANSNGSNMNNSLTILKTELKYNKIRLPYYNSIFHKESYNHWVMLIKGIEYGI